MVTETGNALTSAEPTEERVNLREVNRGLLRRCLENMLPHATLDSVVSEKGASAETPHRVKARGDAIEIEFLGACYVMKPPPGIRFLPPELRLVQSAARVLEQRFLTLFDATPAAHANLLQYMPEDLVLTEFIDSPHSARIPPALEALRAVALSTYENQHLTTGVLLLGGEYNPAEPERAASPGAPLYSERLAALKGIHQMCDGLHTVFLVDHQGYVVQPIEIESWSNRVHGAHPSAIAPPCPRAFLHHARATSSGGHVCVVLMPSHEIKVFSNGSWIAAFTNARWRLLNLAEKYDGWRRAVGDMHPPELVRRLFQVAIDLAEQRRGGLLVVLHNPADAVPRLVAASDRLENESIAPPHPDEPLDQRTFHLLVRGKSLAELPNSVIESLAGLDGALVTDHQGRLLAFGAILHVPQIGAQVRAVAGARTVAARGVSNYGPVLKISEDGVATMFDHGRQVW